MSRSNIKHRYLLVLLLSCFLLDSHLFCLNPAATVIHDSAARKVRLLPEKEKAELLGNEDYKYDRTGSSSESPWEKFKEWLRNNLSKIFNSKEGSIGLQILEYGLVIAAVVIIILLILKNNIRALFYGKSAEVKMDFSEFRENIHSINFDMLISESIAKKDYRKAIRIHFLKVLKDLSDRRLIDWKIDKTNHDYSTELNTTPLSESFNELALLYDRVWYGDMHIDEERYNLLMPKFNTNRFQ
ncbi:MAG TPA: DUF4129 domain-containing protein [Bacteroidia bacterium]|jgi:hypothetical protein